MRNGELDCRKVNSLYSEEVETDLFVPCHTFTHHMDMWEKLKMLCISVDLIFLFVSPFCGDLGQKLFVKCATLL